VLYLLRKCCASKYDVYFDTKLPEIHVPCYGSSEGLFYLVYEAEPEHCLVDVPVNAKEKKARGFDFPNGHVGS
jgi:hypothetical protein